VLFDALERAWKGTSQENLINDLYQGEMKDYVRCQECGHESSRADKYLDIPLVIKGFGESKAIKSVEEALFKFVEPEVLSGDNQYSCEKCSKKVSSSLFSVFCDRHVHVSMNSTHTAPNIGQCVEGPQVHQVPVRSHAAVEAIRLRLSDCKHQTASICM
jgi:DNA-directed RNA polymerase subunit RPC12/RpoP